MYTCTSAKKPKLCEDIYARTHHKTKSPIKYVESKYS